MSERSAPGGPLRAKLAAAGRRATHAARAAWPSGRCGYALLALVLAGVALRLVAIIGWWPTTTTLADSSVYAEFAESNPFADPQHPAGYGLILGALGAVSREVAVPILLQHLSGIGAALLLFAATRRVTGSAWAGLLPAAIILLAPDEILLEHAIVTESSAVLATSGGLYAAVRAFDEPDPWWRWPLLAGVALGLAATIRTAGLLMIPVILIALLVCRPPPSRRLRRWRPALTAAAGAAAVLVVFASANATFGQRFGLGPSAGWYLYGRVAQFADCDRFTPPAGTELLCEDSPAAERRGARYYLFDPNAPAPHRFGTFDEQTDSESDALLGAWSRRAIRAQPGDYLGTVWQYLRVYWVPSLSPVDFPDGEGLDPLLGFTAGLDPDFYAFVQGVVADEMGRFFYNDFTVERDRPALDLLGGLQRVFRFGGTALSITTLLALLGLLIGTRRSRAAVLLFGIGGLALIAAPALTGNYTGRYTVPMAGPLMAAAAVTILELGRWWTVRRRRRAIGG